MKTEFNKEKYLDYLTNLNDKELLRETNKIGKNKEKAQLILLVAIVRQTIREFAERNN